MRSHIARRFGHLVADRRKTMGLSQTELGRRLGTTHQTVSRWELGWNTPDLETLVELADVLGFSLDELRDGVAA